MYCLRFALPLQAKRQDMDKQQNRNQAHLPYRIIALDLDGTLTNHDKVITPKTREALLKAQQEGAIVVLASGRPTYGIVPLANELKLDTHGGFILAYNGGKIVVRTHRQYDLYPGSCTAHRSNGYGPDDPAGDLLQAGRREYCPPDRDAW